MRPNQKEVTREPGETQLEKSTLFKHILSLILRITFTPSGSFEPMSCIPTWLRLANRTAIVTGAGSGIGAAVATSLAHEGCNLLLGDVNSESVEAVASQCRDIVLKNNHFNHHHHDHEKLMTTTKSSESNIVVRSLECNVTNQDHVCALIKEGDEIARRAFDLVAQSSQSASKLPPSLSSSTTTTPPPVASILINCAGITRDALVPNMSVEEFDQVMNVNLRGTFLTCKEFCSSTRLEMFHPPKHKSSSSTHSTDEGNENDHHHTPHTASGEGQFRGSIINIGSVVSQYGNVGQVNYGASKGGVAGLTKCLAKEMARYNVRVNAVLPGFISTPMTDAVPQHIREEFVKRIPLKRFGQPDDVANLCLFLASTERSGYITGQCIECSGMVSL